jgi:phosphoserine phosphatase
VVLVSGGVREAIVPLAATLGIDEHDVNAVRVHFGASGDYVGFDADSPLATQTGKRAVVESLALPRPIVAVGDGATDAAVRPAVDAFVAYTGFARRDAVLAVADHEATSFTQLLELVLA